MTLFKNLHYKLRYLLTGKLPHKARYHITIHADGHNIKNAASVLPWHERYPSLYELGLFEATVEWPFVKTVTGKDAADVLARCPHGFLLSADVTYYVNGSETQLEHTTKAKDITRVVAEGTCSFDSDVFGKDSSL